MPLAQTAPPAEQLWKKADRDSKRNGVRKTAYMPSSGEKYTGDWKNDKREGKGTAVSSKGTIYDGDWANGVRHGYGVRSLLRDGVQVKEYSGGWVNDKKEGYGAQFYSTGEKYEGEWFEGKRSGWGRMYYSDASIYEGEWYDGKRNGTGLLILENGNRYEGSWENDAKHGDGKFYYLEKGQLYIGSWVAGVAKCGEMIDLQRENAVDPTLFPIPNIELEDPRSVLEAARLKHLGEDYDQK